MKKLLFFLLMFSLSALASNTVVTATITGQDGLVWSNGTYKVEFRPAPNNPTPASKYTSGGISFTQLFSGTLDSTGTFSVTLTDTNTISPALSQWIFTICPNASFQCFSSNQIITGGSINLSSTLSNLTPNITINATLISKAYGSGEIIVPPSYGAIMYDTTLGALRTYDGINWTNPLTYQPVVNYYAGSDLGLQLTNALAANTNGGELTIIKSGIINNTVTINNISNLTIRCMPGVTLTNNITGNSAVSPAIKFTGTSSYDTIKDCTIVGNNIVGNGGNGNAIAIIGTGASPAEIHLKGVTITQHKGNGVNSAGGSMLAAGVYISQAIDTFIEEHSSLQSNQYGVFADSNSNDVYIKDSVINSSVSQAVYAQVLSTLNIINNDIESNTQGINLDGVIDAYIVSNHNEANGTDLLVTNAQGFTLNLTAMSNYISHNNNVIGYDISTGAINSLLIGNRFVYSNAVGGNAILLETGTVSPTLINNSFTALTGAILTNGVVVGNGGAVNGATLIGNHCGRTQANVDGTISKCIDINTGSNNTVLNTTCVSNTGGTITSCTQIDASASNTRLDNTTCTASGGTITACETDNGVASLRFTGGGLIMTSFGATGKAACVKANKGLGVCSTQPDASGACTCN